MADFEQIYLAHFTDVYKYVYSLCRDAHLAEEITQEAFYKAMEHLDRFDGRCKLYVWLCQIAKNAYYDHCRRQKKRADAPPDIESPHRVEDALMDREQAMSLHEKLHALDEPYKEVFMLRVFGELDYAQIARLFAKTESWARVTYHRAKTKLMSATKEEDV